MNILVIFTGGTIGSTVRSGFIAPSEDTQYTLLEKYKKLADTNVHFDTDCPYQILSENLDGAYLNCLIDCVKRHENESYDGIIITHGTDTLQYTAATLGLSFYNAKLPIILVSSNYILDSPEANGLDNFCYAVSFIEQKAGNGVFVSYRNDENTDELYASRHIIHDALFLSPHMPYDDKLFSISNNYYGIFKNNGFIKNSSYKNVKISDLLTAPEEFKSITLSPISPVLYVKPIPGQNYPVIPANVKVILLDSYHSGTLCTARPELHDFVRSASERNIDVYLTGVEERIQYESTKKYDSLGIKILPALSPITSYILLWFYYSKTI